VIGLLGSSAWALQQSAVRQTSSTSADWRARALYTALAYNDGEPVLTPYDDCVLVMPSLRQLRPGVTVVRLARRREINS